MPEPILLIRLEGPLQSWGVRSRWSWRDTGPEPSKSAIIGLLGCAAGISRPDWRSRTEPDRTLEQWDNALRFGVRVDRPGTIETDYHTVQGRHWQADGKVKREKTEVKYSGGKWVFWSEIHTEPTWRHYLHDAAFLVALASDNADLLRKLAGELDHPDLPGDLKHPKWPPYLGRKACVPSRPILDRLTDEYQDLKSAFETEPWAAPRSPRERKSLEIAKRPTRLVAWIECLDGEYERQDAMRLNQFRFYDFRRCRRIEIDTGSLRRIP
ncbi:MAG: type I-E CRISPR-associated protein Cas5/CasD [Thermodesulfobacteriota bacterium]